MRSDEENSKYGHKVDYLLSWKDKKGDEWEIAVGEFCGKPFEPDRKKYKDDLHKLFRIMKDMLDCLIDKISTHCNGKINEKIYKVICDIRIFGIISYGKYFVISDDL